ncbi:MAG: tRNA (adenosine(37)-N6)-dimethylallyltransferase MiaA [Candidatus Woesebacteria bacterium]|jgi:tRNA dimethylallyltransferase
MKQLISIIGPTATGKTSLALAIAKQLLKNKEYEGIELISADSRQVYQGLSIITGADVPANFQETKAKADYPYFQHNSKKINLHGVAVIKPNQEWSVAHFKKLALQIIQEAWQKQHLAIVVGGTGLYHQHLFSKSNYFGIPANKELRNKAEKMKLPELQEWLKKINQEKFNQLNRSDKNNPRRLIRRIEIELFVKNSQAKIKAKDKFKPDSQLLIGLQNKLANIKEKIKQRVKQRWQSGAKKEVKAIIRKYPNEKLPALSATGVKEISQFLRNEITEKECLNLWTLREYQYAKRQITWWKKRPGINWLDLSQKNFKKNAFQLVSDYLEQ